MGLSLSAGDRVHTPLGRGEVGELRNNGRVLVDVQGRALVFAAADLRPLEAERAAKGRTRAASTQRARVGAPGGRAPGPGAGPARTREVDLHGLTVEEAIGRIDALLDACMRDDIAQLRVIHGRSGGKLRAALHHRLKGIPSVRAFGLDPANPGVTNVFL